MKCTKQTDSLSEHTGRDKPEYTCITYNVDMWKTANF